MCFKWCDIAHKFPALFHKNRITKYKRHENDVNYSGIIFPVTLNQIHKVEKQNEININIFQLNDDEQTVLPLYFR